MSSLSMSNVPRRRRAAANRMAPYHQQQPPGAVIRPRTAPAFQRSKSMTNAGLNQQQHYSTWNTDPKDIQNTADNLRQELISSKKDLAGVQSENTMLRGQLKRSEDARFKQVMANQAFHFLYQV